MINVLYSFERGNELEYKTTSQKVFFSAMTHKVFKLYKLRLFI